jgi:Hemerythrin HHE cation binding domain
MQTRKFQLDMTMMFATHDALRRDVERAAKISTRTPGWDLFARFLHKHHTSEDEALWPVVRREVEDRPDDLTLIDSMEAEHAAIGPLLTAIDDAFGDDTARAQLEELVATLDAELRNHLDHEERDALPVIDAALTAEQWMSFGEASTKALGPDVPRFFPWLLEAADATTTEHVLGLVPDPVRQAYGNEWLPAYEAEEWWPGGR